MSNEKCEWEWEAFSVSACEAYHCAQAAKAIHLWSRADELAGTFAPNDPRRAASANNTAIGFLIAEQTVEAAAGFAEAARLWKKAGSWAKEMDVKPIARSSLFHLRMAERHEGAFDTVRRARNLELLEGTHALTHFNQAIALLFLDDDDEADRLLLQAAGLRETACGPNNYELARINQVIAGRHEHAGNHCEARALDRKVENSQAEQSRWALECWREEQPVELDDPRRLLAAAHLTAMVHERDFT